MISFLIFHYLVTSVHQNRNIQVNEEEDDKENVPGKFT